MFRAVQYYTHYPALRTKYYRQLLFEHIIAKPKQWVIFGTVLEPLPDTPTDLSTAALTRYDTRCYFNVRSKADISQLNLPHGTDN